MKAIITTNEGIRVGRVTENYEVLLDEDEVPVNERETIRELVAYATSGDTETTPGAVQGDSVTPPEERVEYPPEIGLERVAWIIPQAGAYQAEVVGDVSK